MSLCLQWRCSVFFVVVVFLLKPLFQFYTDVFMSCATAPFTLCFPLCLRSMLMYSWRDSWEGVWRPGRPSVASNNKTALISRHRFKIDSFISMREWMREHLWKLPCYSEMRKFKCLYHWVSCFGFLKPFFSGLWCECFLKEISPTLACFAGSFQSQLQISSRQNFIVVLRVCIVIELP